MATSEARRGSLFYLLQIGGWGSFGAAMIVAGLSQWAVDDTLVRKSSLTLLGFLASTLLRLPYRALRRRNIPLPLCAAAALPLSFVAAGGWMALHNVVINAYVRRIAPLAGFPDFLNTIYYFFVLFAWSLLYLGIKAQLDHAADSAADRERLLRAELLARQASLRALRFQLNPHFLFNALNGISTLIAEGRAGEANAMLASFSSFLRHTLDRPDVEEVPLGEEIDCARRYLDIERIRIGDRLRVDIDVAPSAAGALVPAMILQPLIENALRHAVHPRREGGSISVTAGRDEAWLTLGVHDDGPGLPDPRPAGGIGLSNTASRLETMYGAGSALAFSRSALGGLAVSLRLPFRTMAGEQ
jgi:LytS/YehU family sensor histidine kinase